jgi:hypothetical protein
MPLAVAGSSTTISAAVAVNTSLIVAAAASSAGTTNSGQSSLTLPPIEMANPCLFSTYLAAHYRSDI